MSEELKPCPLCADPMRWNTGRRLFIHVNENPDCPLGGLAFPEHRLAAWNTRPAANVEVEPVAWLYERRNRWPQTPDVAYYTSRERLPNRRQNGWTETPLHPASALEAARREALEEAAKVCEEWDENSPHRSRATAIRALNGGLNEQG